MNTTGQRLFTPGDGATPPALTGREREEAVLTRCLGDLLGGRAPPHNVVLTGPRGTGKTVLLNWFERACRDYVTDVDVAKLTPGRHSDPGRADRGSGAARRDSEAAAPQAGRGSGGLGRVGAAGPGARATCGRN